MEKIFDIPKRWILVWRSKSRPAIYQQWTYGDSLEMQAPLTTGSTTNQLETSTTYHPCRSQPKAATVRKSFKSKSRFAGWRFGVLNFAVCASVVFLINLVATIVGTTATKEGKGVLFEGDCDRIKRINTGLHLLINILGTILLAGSNYSMQCLSAPTRAEIDSSHCLTPSASLDIGIPSIRNIIMISRHRVVLWCLLGLSSLPLHLL
jgi:hypothetical protein